MPTRSFAAQARADTPLGPITLAATERGLAGLWFDDQKHHPGAIEAPVDASQRWIVQALDELAGYWRDGSALFTIALDPQGTPFQQSVWEALRGIPAGRTLSYGGLAQQLGRASAVRAVGAAIGRNPVAVIVPCHRVLGTSGSLTGYAGGLERKAALLRIEGCLL